MSSSSDVTDSSSGFITRSVARLLLASGILLGVVFALSFVPIEYTVLDAIIGLTVVLHFSLLWVLLRRTRRIEEKLDDTG